MIYWSLVSQGRFCEHLTCHFLHGSCKHQIRKVHYLPGPACNNSEAVLVGSQGHCVVSRYLLPTNGKLRERDQLAIIITITEHLYFFHIKPCITVFEHPACCSGPKDISVPRPGDKNRTRHEVFCT